MQPSNLYYRNQDRSIYYNLNVSTGEAIKQTSISRTKVLLTDLSDLVKCKKAEYNSKKNEYYRTAYFEWVYNTKHYNTIDIDIEEKIINKSESGNYLVFHNGYIWELDCYGQYLPQVFLRKIGKDEGKWTNIKNCRNFKLK